MEKNIIIKPLIIRKKSQSVTSRWNVRWWFSKPIQLGLGITVLVTIFVLISQEEQMQKHGQKIAQCEFVFNYARATLSESSIQFEIEMVIGCCSKSELNLLILFHVIKKFIQISGYSK